jgi:hypothetical protein
MEERKPLKLLPPGGGHESEAPSQTQNTRTGLQRLADVECAQTMFGELSIIGESSVILMDRKHVAIEDSSKEVCITGSVEFVSPDDFFQIVTRVGEYPTQRKWDELMDGIHFRFETNMNGGEHPHHLSIFTFVRADTGERAFKELAGTLPREKL